VEGGSERKDWHRRGGGITEREEKKGEGEEAGESGGRDRMWVGEEARGGRVRGAGMTGDRGSSLRSGG